MPGLSPPTTETIAHVSLLLAIVLAAAKLGGEIAVRLKQPPVLGELLAGVLLGAMPWPAGYYVIRFATPSNSWVRYMGLAVEGVEATPDPSESPTY